MILIYSTPTCAFCVQVKKYLDKVGVAWEERDALTDPNYPDLANRFGMTVPLVYNGIDGMVGWNITRLKELL